MMLY